MTSTNNRVIPVGSTSLPKFHIFTCIDTHLHVYRHEDERLHHFYDMCVCKICKSWHVISDENTWTKCTRRTDLLLSSIKTSLSRDRTASILTKDRNHGEKKKCTEFSNWRMRAFEKMISHRDTRFFWTVLDETFRCVDLIDDKIRLSNYLKKCISREILVVILNVYQRIKYLLLWVRKLRTMIFWISTSLKSTCSITISLKKGRNIMHLQNLRRFVTTSAGTTYYFLSNRFTSNL